jgi:hypothetical protein
MPDETPGPLVDAQTLTDIDTHVFEAIATLEFTGRRPGRSAIGDAAQLDDAVLDHALAELTTSGLLTMTRDHGERVYIPARRDWSTQPAEAAGHLMR